MMIKIKNNNNYNTKVDRLKLEPKNNNNSFKKS